MAVGALAVLHDLVEIALQRVRQFVDLGAQLCRRACTPLSASCNSSISSAESAEKLLTKLSGFLISCAMPAVSWPSEASFSRLDQAVLRGAQILQRFRQFARARLNALEQPHVLDRDRRLVGEGRDQLDLLVGEWPHFRARQGQDADRDALAQHRDAENRAEIAQSLRLDQRIFRIGLYVGDMNHPAFEQRAPGRRASFGSIGISLT